MGHMYMLSRGPNENHHSLKLPIREDCTTTRANTQRTEKTRDPTQGSQRLVRSGGGGVPGAGMGPAGSSGSQTKGSWKAGLPEVPWEMKLLGLKAGLEVIQKCRGRSAQQAEALPLASQKLNIHRKKQESDDGELGKKNRDRSVLKGAQNMPREPKDYSELKTCENQQLQGEAFSKFSLSS